MDKNMKNPTGIKLCISHKIVTPPLKNYCPNKSNYKNYLQQIKLINPAGLLRWPLSPCFTSIMTLLHTTPHLHTTLKYTDDDDLASVSSFGQAPRHLFGKEKDLGPFGISCVFERRGSRVFFPQALWSSWTTSSATRTMQVGERGSLILSLPW